MSEETVMAKHAFERSTEQHGVKILHYHADNGRFADNAFITVIAMINDGACCEVIVGSAPKCLPTSVPVLPILLRATLYFLQYLQSFPPILHLFYLTRCLHS